MAKKEAKEKLERSYNVPLRKSFREIVKHKKTPRAVRALKDFLQKHMKCEDVKLGMHLNEYMWKHGIKNPPHHVKVHAVKEDNVVKAELEGFDFKEAVKAIAKKKEPETMKDKLAAKLGVKEELVKGEEKEEKKEEAKAEEKTEAKPEDKKPETKKEAPKKEIKEKTPTTHDLAAKKTAENKP
ncbi:60S ribosomal protein L31 [Candidatus Woesearchaeota archaeon]|nr:60S ribosomal protein L31 [Candidatus Woesearchaeota archaeon]